MSTGPKTTRRPRASCYLDLPPLIIGSHDTFVIRQANLHVVPSSSLVIDHIGARRYSIAEMRLAGTQKRTEPLTKLGPIRGSRLLAVSAENRKSHWL